MRDESKAILVVDDSITMQTLMVSKLGGHGYRVDCASSGEAALQLLTTTSYNLVLTDIIMPGMSGLNLLKMVKELQPDVEVVIVTSNASSFTAIKALRLGAYDFIVKPIDDDTILANVVERALEKQQLSRENRRLITDLSEKNHDLAAALEMMRILNRTCAMLASSLDIGEILRLLVEQAVDQLRAKKGYLLLLDRTGSEFAMKVTVGIDHALVKHFSLRADQGISGLVAQKMRPLRIGTDIPMAVTNKMLEEDFSGELFTTPGILSVPLTIKDRVAGVVNVSGRDDGRPFTDTEVEFLTGLATHAAIALNNAGLFHKLKKSGA